MKIPRDPFAMPRRSDPTARPAPTRKNPMRAKRSKMFAAIDTETRGLNGPLALAQMFHETWSEARVYPSAARLLDDLFALPRDLLTRTIFYAHNAVYDWRYFLDAFVARMDAYEFRPCERAQGNFYEIQVYSKTETTPRGLPARITTFRDSMAVFDGSLAAFTQSFAPQFVKQDIGLSSGVIFNRMNPVHVEYAKNDVVGLVAALIRFNEIIYENFHVHLRGTIASTAYQGWLRFAPEGVYHNRLPDTVDDFVRQAYYGGNVSMNAPLGVPTIGVNGYDINSSYPDAMRRGGVPTGHPRFTTAYAKGDIGFYQATFTIPDDAKLPIIPHRDDKGRLSFPTGVFTTKITSLEIDYARSLGWKVAVHWGYRFPQIHFPFNEYIDTCERLREAFKASGDKPAETVVKLMQNSPYGRFGMKPEGRVCTLSETCPDDMTPIIDAETGEAIPHAFFRDEGRDTEYMIPSYSAWITANARIALDQLTTLAGRDAVRYRDTDSLSIAGKPRPEFFARLSKAYGDVKDEGEKREFMVHAPKCCTWKDASGAWRTVIKGMPEKRITTEFIEDYRAGLRPAMDYMSTTGLIPYIRTGQKQVMRKRRPTDEKEVYGHIVENGWWRPRRA